MVELVGITLENLAGGAAAEQFEHELVKVLRNINDPNTDSEAKREITLKVSFLPASDRESANVVIKVDSKLAGLKPVATAIWLGEDPLGRPTAVGRDLRQREIFEKDDSGIVPMRKTPEAS